MKTLETLRIKVFHFFEKNYQCLLSFHDHITYNTERGSFQCFGKLSHSCMCISFQSFTLCTFNIVKYLSSFDAMVFASIIFSWTSSILSQCFLLQQLFLESIYIRVNITFSIIHLLVFSALSFFFFCQFLLLIHFIKYHIILSLGDMEATQLHLLPSVCALSNRCTVINQPQTLKVVVCLVTLRYMSFIYVVICHLKS